MPQTQQTIGKELWVPLVAALSESVTVGRQNRKPAARKRLAGLLSVAASSCAVLEEAVAGVDRAVCSQAVLADLARQRVDGLASMLQANAPLASMAEVASDAANRLSYASAYPGNVLYTWYVDWFYDNEAVPAGLSPGLFGVDQRTVAAHLSLGALIAHHRGFPPERWNEYVVTEQDFIHAAGMMPDANARHRPLGWFGVDRPSRRAGLQVSRLLDHLNPSTAEAVIALADEWVGTTDELLAAAARL